MNKYSTAFISHMRKLKQQSSQVRHQGRLTPLELDLQTCILTTWPSFLLLAQSLSNI